MTLIPLCLFVLAPATPATSLASSATPTPHSFAAPNWNAAVAATTQASFSQTPFEYTYIDVVYQGLDRGNGAPDQDGIAFRGSFDVTDNIRLLASFGEAGGDTPAGKDKVRDYSIGFGMHGSYNAWLDVIGNFEWVRRDFSGVSEGRHKGWIAGVGARMLPVRTLEVDALLLFQNSAEDDVGAQLGGVWNFSPYVGLRLTGASIGDETRYTGGLRFSM